jgi:hypothetical protein
MTTTTRPAELNDGIWTSWLPVTTAWPSQAACDTAIWARVGINTDSGYWPYIFDPEYGQSVANTPTCLPPAATQWWEQTPDTDLPQITSYSLGPLVCPEAYTTVTTTVVKSSSTSVICCPRYTHPPPNPIPPIHPSMANGTVISTLPAACSPTPASTACAHQP